MDLEPIIKAAPEIAKGAAVVGAAIPFTAIVKRMLGPAADEVAEMWRDKVRLYRYERQIKCVEKTEKMARNAGFTPKAVPPKILFPLLEGASLEDNEDLHTMWAALLANAAYPEVSDTVRPGFIAILKHLSHDEAVLLKWMRDQLPTTAFRVPISYTGMEFAYAKLFGKLETVHPRVSSEGDSRCRICVSAIVATGLIEKTVDSDVEGVGYAFTWYGYEFIAACQPPTPKPKS